MNEEAKYYRVGLFLLAGAVLTVGAILALGGGNLFTQEVTFETYLDESVQGLDVGSPVKLRGVRIGTVSEIGFLQDYYATSTEQRMSGRGNVVVVRMTVVDRGEGRPYFDYTDVEEARAFLEGAIESGLRLQIAQAGLTGTSFMQADYVEPDKYPPMQIDWTPDNYYVPSAPSTFKTFSTAAERILAKLESLEVERVIAAFDDFLTVATDRFSDVDVDGVQAEAIALLGDLRETNAIIQLEITGDADVSAVSRFERAVDELQGLLQSLRHTSDTTGYDLATTLANLRVISEDLRELTSNARAYPSHVIFGDAPPRVRGQDDD